MNNIENESRQLTKDEIREGKLSREEFRKHKRNPIYLVLDGLKCAHNVGTIIRLCTVKSLAFKLKSSIFIEVDVLLLSAYKSPRSSPNNAIFQPQLNNILNVINGYLYLKGKHLTAWPEVANQATNRTDAS
jgi:hypothetical protein